MSAGTVTVALKLSFPLVLTVSKGHWEEFTPPNGRPSKVFVPGKTESHTVRGFGAQRRLESAGHATGETNHVVGNFGLTPNIPADFWDAWLDENNRPGSSFYAMINSGLIFAHSRQSYAAAQAKERHGIKSGTEALIPQTFDRAGNRTSERDERIAPSIQTFNQSDGL